MHILKSQYNDRHVWHLEGVLNAANVAQLKEEMESILQSDILIVVLDVEHLIEIDSSGIGAIVSLLKRMRMKKGDVRLLRLRGDVKRLFELLRIDRSMEVFEELEQALA
jgi:anti-sigma B factor antagonist